MHKVLIVVGAFCLTSFSPNAEAKTKARPKAKTQQAKATGKKLVKPAVAKFTVMQRMGKIASPPITAEEKAKAKGRFIWRRIPYSQLSGEERKDPNWSEGINPKTGRVEAIMNP